MKLAALYADSNRRHALPGAAAARLRVSVPPFAHSFDSLRRLSRP
jgi:hypothetical protein